MLQPALMALAQKPERRRRLGETIVRLPKSGLAAAKTRAPWLKKPRAVVKTRSAWPETRLSRLKTRAAKLKTRLATVKSPISISTKPVAVVKTRAPLSKRSSQGAAPRHYSALRPVHVGWHQIRLGRDGRLGSKKTGRSQFFGGPDSAAGWMKG